MNQLQYQRIKNDLSNLGFLVKTSIDHNDFCMFGKSLPNLYFYKDHSGNIMKAGLLKKICSNEFEELGDEDNCTTMFHVIFTWNIWTGSWRVALEVLDQMSTLWLSSTLQSNWDQSAMCVHNLKKYYHFRKTRTTTRSHHLRTWAALYKFWGQKRYYVTPTTEAILLTTEHHFFMALIRIRSQDGWKKSCLMLICISTYVCSIYHVLHVMLLHYKNDIWLV